MGEVFNLFRLIQCNDSSFPSGAFAFSSGLETLVNEGRVRNRANVQHIIVSQILPRWLAFDRYFVAKAFDCAGDLQDLAVVDAECHWANPIEKSARASRRIGRAMLDAHSKIGTPSTTAYRSRILAEKHGDSAGYEPVIQGLISSSLGLEKQQAEIVALNSTLTGFVSAAIRLGKLGAIEAQSVLCDLSTHASSGLAENPPIFPSSFSPLADIAVTRNSSSGSSLFAT